MTSVPDIFHKRWGHLFEHCMLTGKENNTGDMYRPRSLTPSCLSSAADQLVGKPTGESWQTERATCSIQMAENVVQSVTLLLTFYLSFQKKWTNTWSRGVSIQKMKWPETMLNLKINVKKKWGVLFFLTLKLVTTLDQKCFFFTVHVLLSCLYGLEVLWSPQVRVPHKWDKRFKSTPNFSWGRRSWINREKSHQRTIQLRWNSLHSSLKERVKCLDLAGAVFYKLQSHCFLRERVWHLKVSIVQPPDIPCWAFFFFLFLLFVLSWLAVISTLSWIGWRADGAILFLFVLGTENPSRVL